MQVQPNSFWIYDGSQMHKVLDIGPVREESVLVPHVLGEFKASIQPWITTWSVGAESKPEQLLLPPSDDLCWSWYGPLEEFKKWFRK